MKINPRQAIFLCFQISLEILQGEISNIDTEQVLFRWKTVEHFVICNAFSAHLTITISKASEGCSG